MHFWKLNFFFCKKCLKKQLEKYRLESSWNARWENKMKLKHPKIALSRTPRLKLIHPIVHLRCESFCNFPKAPNALKSFQQRRCSIKGTSDKMNPQRMLFSRGPKRVSVVFHRVNHFLMLGVVDWKWRACSWVREGRVDERAALMRHLITTSVRIPLFYHQLPLTW